MATRRVIEALAEAIIAYSGYHDPASAVYQARNPGALPATSVKHHRDAQGNRVFNSVRDGWQALVYEVEMKVSGKSRDALAGDSTLSDLAMALSSNRVAAVAWCKFLRKALQDESINPATELKRFW